MHSIHTHHTVFKLCMIEKKERWKMNKIKIFMFGFLDRAKVSGTYEVYLAMKQPRDVVCNIFHSSALFF